MPHGHDGRRFGREERPEERALSQPKARALSREEIAKSADLQRRYTREYASMLRVVPDREVAKEAARINVSALLQGEPRIVPREGRFTIGQLKDALARAGRDLGSIRSAFSRLLEPEASRLQLPLGRDFGPDR